MTTFKDLLSLGHDYLPSDFGAADGEVVIDSNKGTVHPLGAEGKAVALDQVFKVGQYVSLDLHGGGAERLRFVVLGVNHDGLNAVSPQGEKGFLPWELMAAALRKSRQVFVDVLSELKDLDEDEQAIVREEIARLTRELCRHRAIVAELGDQIDKLESIGRRSSGASPNSDGGP